MIASIIVAVLLALVVFLIIRKMVRDKRAGKSSCGGGCVSCPLSGSCHRHGE